MFPRITNQKISEAHWQQRNLAQSLVGWVGSQPADLSKKNRKTNNPPRSFQRKEAKRSKKNLLKHHHEICKFTALSSLHVQTGYLQNCLLQTEPLQAPKTLTSPTLEQSLATSAHLAEISCYKQTTLAYRESNIIRVQSEYNHKNESDRVL